MRALLLFLVIVPVALLVYAYVLYPVALRILSTFRSTPAGLPPPEDWPAISITVPVHNAESSIVDTLESLLDVDYPADRRQVLVVLDGCTDGTEQVVSQFAERGVEAVPIAERVGKTAAENAAAPRLTGEIIINTDVSVRVHPDAPKQLVTQFSDPTVGLASGRDVSVVSWYAQANIGESGYVGYEMWLRSFETRVGGIVGASGCLYAVRREIHRMRLPDTLSRDFAAALLAREKGQRAVSVAGAVCYVPRTRSQRKEYRRKVRTMTRGLQTLFYKRHLLDVRRYGVFAWMLFSHKLVRWLAAAALLPGLVSLIALSLNEPWALCTLVIACAIGIVAVSGWLWPEHRPVPRLVAIPAYVVAANLAGLHAWFNLIRGERNPAWEPTHRE